MSAADDVRFDNILAVVDHLSGRGWKIAKSSAYNHSKEGKLRPREDGKYYLKDVEKYARAFLRRVDQTATGMFDDLQERKLQAETDKLIAQAEHWQIKARAAAGQYVPRDLFELELAKRAAVFKNDIESFIRAQALGIIHLVGGSADKAPDLIEWMLDHAEEWLDRYAEEREFRVPEEDADTTDDETDEE